MESLDYIKELMDAYENEVPDAITSNIERALVMFTKIKEDEKRRQTWCDKNEQPELFWAKYDLKRLKLGFDGLTKNQIYMKHQSEIVNRIVYVLNERDLLREKC